LKDSNLTDSVTAKNVGLGIMVIFLLLFRSAQIVTAGMGSLSEVFRLQIAANNDAPGRSSKHWLIRPVDRA